MLGLITLLAQELPGETVDWSGEGRATRSHWIEEILRPGKSLAVAVIGGWILLLILLALLKIATRYRVGPKHLIVSVLGLPVRRIRLDNIRYLTTQRVRFAERWHNQVFVKPQTVLVVRKRRGLFKNLVITPHQRHLFMAEINRARDGLVASEGILADFGGDRR